MMRKIISLLVCISSILIVLCIASTVEASVPCIISNTSAVNNVLISSTQLIPKAKLCAASYAGGKLKDLKMQDISLGIGNNQFGFTNLLMTNADTVKYILWSDKLRPYANSLAQTLKLSYSVSFVDWNGAVLKTQTVAIGTAATPPNSPARVGYVFAGWNGIYKNVYADTTIIAIYVTPPASNIFTVSSANGKVGDTITLMVSLGGTVNTCGFDLRLSFDSSVLELVSYDPQWSLDVVANYLPATSTVRFNYGSSKNRTIATTIMAVTFKIKNSTATYTNVALTPVEVIFADANNGNIPTPVNYTLIDGMVFIQ